jgi:transposase
MSRSAPADAEEGDDLSIARQRSLKMKIPAGLTWAPQLEACLRAVFALAPPRPHNSDPPHPCPTAPGCASGRPTTLSDQQMMRLYSLIVGRDSRQYSFGAALWTRKLIGELIFQKFQVRLSLPTVGRIVTKLGMSPQQPLYRASQQDPAKVEQWKRETPPRGPGPPSSSLMRLECGPTTTRTPRAGQSVGGRLTRGNVFAVRCGWLAPQRA